MNKLIPLALLAQCALGAVYQNCVAFETPFWNKGAQLNLKTSIDTSVLVYKLQDTANTNIPFEATQELIQSEKKGFTVCGTKLHSVDRCENLGEFVVKPKEGGDNELPTSITNKFLPAGEHLNYNIKEGGIYCVIAYQENDEEVVKGLDHQYVHSYGMLPLAGFAELLMNLINILITFMTMGAFSYILSKGTDYQLSIPHSMIKTGLHLNAIVCISKILLLTLGNKGWLSSTSTRGTLQYISLFSTVSAYYILFMASLNESVIVEGMSRRIKKLSEVKSNYTKYFKILISLLVGKVVVVDILEKFFLSRDGPITFVLDLLHSLISVPLIIIYNKNFHLVSQEILDLAYLKNFKRSRVICFSVPVILTVVPIFYISIISIVQGGKTGFDPDNLDKTSGDILAESMNTAVKLSTLMISDLIEFTVVVICIELLVVWRPKVIEPASSGHLRLGSDENEGGTFNEENPFTSKDASEKV